VVENTNEQWIPKPLVVLLRGRHSSVAQKALNNMIGNTELREIHGHKIGNVKIPFVAGKGDKCPCEKVILNSLKVCGMRDAGAGWHSIRSGMQASRPSELSCLPTVLGVNRLQGGLK
jgi:hypothetical protein